METQTEFVDDLFSDDDVLAAIAQCNYDKALGED